MLSLTRIRFFHFTSVSNHKETTVSALASMGAWSVWRKFLLTMLPQLQLLIWTSYRNVFLQKHPSAYLWVVPKLIVKSLPGALIRVCNGDVVSIRQGPKLLPGQGDATLKEWQHCVAEIEAFLHCKRADFTYNQHNVSVYKSSHMARVVLLLNSAVQVPRLNAVLHCEQGRFTYYVDPEGRMNGHCV